MIPAMLRRAGTLTLCVYALRTAAAVLFGWPLAVDWSAAVTQHMFGSVPSPGDAALLTELAARRGPEQLLWSGAALALYCLLSPIVGVAWAHALSRSSSVRESLVHGMRRARAALGIAVALLAGWLGMLGGCALLLARGLPLLPASAPIELGVRAGCVLLALAGALALATLYDLACATQAEAALPVGRALTVAARAMSLRTLAQRTLLALGIAGCFLLAELAGRNTASAIGATGVLLLQQSLVFVATTLRAACLALALARIKQH